MCWQHDDNDTYILNVDIDALINPKQACYGGLGHNLNGQFQIDYYDSVGLSNILHVEIQILFTETTLCWNTNFLYSLVSVKENTQILL